MKIIKKIPSVKSARVKSGRIQSATDEEVVEAVLKETQLPLIREVILLEEAVKHVDEALGCVKNLPKFKDEECAEVRDFCEKSLNECVELAKKKLGKYNSDATVKFGIFGNANLRFRKMIADGYKEEDVKDFLRWFNTSLKRGSKVSSGFSNTWDDDPEKAKRQFEQKWWQSFGERVSFDEVADKYIDASFVEACSTVPAKGVSSVKVTSADKSDSKVEYWQTDLWREIRKADKYDELLDDIREKEKVVDVTEDHLNYWVVDRPEYVRKWLGL